MTYIPGGAGAPLTVKEQDDSPSISNVTTIRVSNGTLTNPGGGVAEIATGGGGIAAPDYFTYLAALLEPDAILPLEYGTFTHVITSTEFLIASFATQLNGTGRMEQRDPREPMPLCDVTVTGSSSTSVGIFLDPALPTYADAYNTYFERLKQIAELPTKTIAFTGASQQVPLLPGAYGAIIINATNFDATWVICNYNTAGIMNLANEIGDTGATDSHRYSNRLNLPVTKYIVNEGAIGAAAASPAGSISYVLLPSTWSAIPDLTTYDFRDDFMGASLDTATDWTRAQSTAGNIEIDINYQWLKILGNGSWGANGIYAQSSIARAAGKIFLIDVFVPRQSGTSPVLGVGLSDGAGQSYTNFAHMLAFTNGGAGVYDLVVLEDGTSRGNVGSGYTPACTYRVRITLTAGSDAIYEIQGGTEYAPMGGGAWTDITPGTSSSAKNTLHAALSCAAAPPFYVSDARVY